MCGFYMGIAQIALDPPPRFVKRANVKKVSQTILASPYTPGQIYANKMLQPSLQAFTRPQGGIFFGKGSPFLKCVGSTWFYMQT